MGIRNIDNMEPLKNPSNFRKLSMGNWYSAHDAQVHALLELDCEKALAYIDELRQQGRKITINHVITRAIALTLRKYPQLNGIISRKKIYLRKNVDIFLQVSIENAETELVGICIRNADEKGVFAIAEEIVHKSERVRSSPNDPIRSAQGGFRYIPWRLMTPLMGLLDWLMYDMNINLSWLGLPKDGFGSIMITSIGSLGIELAFVPLANIGRVPTQVAVGKIAKKPVVIDDEIVIRPIINLCCTFDHRFMDGLLASKMAKYVKELVENIDRHRELIEGIEERKEQPL